MLDRITASLSSLAPAEQRVGKLVLTDPRAFARLPVRELAERAHVSKPCWRGGAGGTALGAERRAGQGACLAARAWG